MTTDPDPDRPADPGRPDPAGPRAPGSGAASAPEPATAHPLDGDVDSVGTTPTGIGADEVHDGTEPTAAIPGTSDEPTAAGPFDGTGWPPPGGAYPPPPGPGFPPGGAYPPPGTGFPPPGPGAGFPPPFSPGGIPPGTGGWATRFGLSRPRDRYVAGVSGAFARATNTDPVLWRVGLAVLTLLGGLGILIYVLGWLLLPADGDSGSPLEALTGRAWSSTSRGVTIVLLIVGAGGLIGALTRGALGQGALAFVIVGGAVLLLTGKVPRLTRTPSPTGGIRWDLTFTDMHAAAGSTPTATPGTMTGTSTAGVTDTPGRTPAATPTYRAPYAPHGPYAADTGYDFPGLAPTMPMPVPPPAPPARPQPRRGRSTPARKITLSCTMLVVGVLAILDVSNVIPVPTTAYFAAALATVGLGLIVGAFANNGRGPVTIGGLLLVGLLLSNWVTGVHGAWAAGQLTYQPAALAAIQPNYSERLGRITLDLRDVDFRDTATPNTVSVRVNVGEITVLLPPEVDVHVDAQANVGTVRVFDQDRNGVNTGRLLVDDPGKDGPGGGRLNLILRVNLGEVEVKR